METALIYDAVMLFALALDNLDQSQVGYRDYSVKMDIHRGIRKELIYGGIH